MYIWFDFDASFITYYFFLLIGGKDKDKKGGDKDKAKGAESKDHIHYLSRKMRADIGSCNLLILAFS